MQVDSNWALFAYSVFTSQCKAVCDWCLCVCRRSPSPTCCLWCVPEESLQRVEGFVGSLEPVTRFTGSSGPRFSHVALGSSWPAVPVLSNLPTAGGLSLNHVCCDSLVRPRRKGAVVKYHGARVVALCRVQASLCHWTEGGLTLLKTERFGKKKKKKRLGNYFCVVSWWCVLLRLGLALSLRLLLKVYAKDVLVKGDPALVAELRRSWNGAAEFG